MNNYRYSMAFIDWHKYGHSFKSLREQPERLLGCIGTLLSDFTQKDLLKGRPDDAPWDAIREIQSIGPRAMHDLNSGRPLDSNTEARLRACCLRFGEYASEYFASETPPWERRQLSSRSSDRPSGSGCLGLFSTWGFIANVVWILLNAQWTSSHSPLQKMAGELLLGKDYSNQKVAPDGWQLAMIWYLAWPFIIATGWRIIRRVLESLTSRVRAH